MISEDIYLTEEQLEELLSDYWDKSRELLLRQDRSDLPRMIIEDAFQTAFEFGLEYRKEK